jgi:hypothetical protein
MNDMGNRAAIYRIETRQGAKRLALLMACANSQNVALRQFGAAVTFAMWMSTPLFVLHVSHVIGMRAQEQMVWVHAPRDIAGVAHLDAGWNWATMQDPRDTMSQLDSSLEREDAVPSCLSASLPVPAGRRHLDSAQKSLQSGGKRVLSIASPCEHGAL